METEEVSMAVFLWWKGIILLAAGNEPLAGKSRGGTPFCRTLKIGFPKRSSPRNTTWIWFGKAGAHPQLALGSQLPLKPCILIAASRLKRQLRFFAILCDSLLDFCCISFESLICSANVGYSPTPRQHFWKIAGSKNFWLPAAHSLQPVRPCKNIDDNGKM